MSGTLCDIFFSSVINYLARCVLFSFPLSPIIWHAVLCFLFLCHKLSGTLCYVSFPSVTNYLARCFMFSFTLFTGIWQIISELSGPIGKQINGILTKVPIDLKGDLSHYIGTFSFIYCLSAINSANNSYVHMYAYFTNKLNTLLAIR